MLHKIKGTVCKAAKILATSTALHVVILQSHSGTYCCTNATMACTMAVHSCYLCLFRTVPGPVSGLSASPGVVQLTISWSPPSEPNGIITMYQVSYNISGVLNYTNTSATQHTLRDLPPNTVVTFSVRAYTIIGPGEAVSDSTSTTAIRECRKLVNYMYIYMYKLSMIISIRNTL